MRKTSLFVGTLLFISAVAFAANEPAPGSAVNDKIRLVQVETQGGNPLLIHSLIAVRDADGLSAQLQNGKKFYIDWTVSILNGATVVRTLSQREQIAPPFNWVQLSRAVPSDNSCGGVLPPNANNNAQGTEPFVQIESTVSWDGKDESGNTIAFNGLTYRADATVSRITPSNGQTAILGIAVPHCDQVSIPDSEGPIIKITGVEESQYLKADAQITVEITDSSGVTEQDIKVDDAPFTSGSSVTAEGSHTLDVSARDTFGNLSSQTVHFTIDKTAPEIVITGVDPDRFYPQPVSPIVDIRDGNPDSATISLDNQPFTSGTVISLEARHELLVTAKDKAGNTSQKLIAFGIDRTAPQIFIQNPKSGSLQAADTIQVSGTLVEQFLREVTVNGVKALASSDLFQLSSLHLTEGLNTIVVVATDLAGNSSVQSTTVVFDQTPPGISITIPQGGALFNQSLIAVSGALQGNDIVSVKVNGAAALITGSNYGIGNLRLSEGVNTIHAVVTDTAGNSTDATIQVTLDTVAPRIAMTEPLDGSVTTASSTNVSGFVSDTTAISLTINGNAVSVGQDGSFHSNVALAEGSNLITLVARDALNNEMTIPITVTRDSTALEVVSITPPNGSLGVPVNQLIEILFSEQVKSATVTGAIELKTGSNLIPVTLQPIGNRVTVTPQSPLSGAGSYTLTVNTAITDLVGNPLKSAASSTFSTVDTLPPAPPVLSPQPPSVTSEETITITGAAEAKSKVQISGGAARIDVLASDTGQFTAQVPLFTDAVNQLSLAATDISGNTSAATTATIIQDSQRMVVVDATYQTDGSLLLSFSKAPDFSSVTPQNIYILATSTISGSAALTANPNDIIFYPQQQLGTSPFVLKVETTLRDASGKNLEYPWSKLFNAASGESFVQGEVYDNATGLPLAGASVQQIVPAKNPAPIATTDLKGQFVLPTSSGSILLRITRAGYQYVDRAISAPAGSAAVMFDARLQPEDPAALTISTTAATVQNSDGSVLLEVPSNAVAQNATAHLNSRDGQSLPALLPDGWSPVAVASIDTTATFQQDVKLKVRNIAQMPAFATIATAYYDGSLWKYGEPAFVTSDGAYIEIDTNKAGTHIFLVPDPQNPPPAQQQDAPLTAATTAELQPPGTPLLTSTPTGIYPEGKAQVDTTFTGNVFRSGTKFQAILSEDFTLLEGLGSVQTTPRTADLVGYAMGKPSNGELRFYASPSKAIDFSKLDVGFINVSIHAFPHAAEQPGVIDTGGGTVNSSTGDMHLVIPAGALDRAVPVTLSAYTLDQIHLPLADYTLVSAFEVNIAGSTLSLPATIDAPATLPGTPQLIIARLAQIGVRSLWVIDGTATFDGARVRSTTGPGSLRGITIGGTYGVFLANRAIGFISGNITNPQNGSAGAGILVLSNQTQLASMSSTLSTFTLAVPVSAGVAKAVNQISGDEGIANYTVSSINEVVPLNLHIQTTPPRVVSITPENGAAGIDPNTGIRVTFSEPILASTLNASTFYLTDFAGSVVSAQVLLTSNNTVGVLALQTSLGPDLDFTVVVTSGITDASGNALANPTNSKFHTLDSVPPRTAADARFKLFLPENGVVKFQAPEEDMEQGTSVIFFNDTQRTSVSAVLQNGNFTASIAGTITDKFFVLLKDAAGNETHVDFKLMEFPDGSGAVFPTMGGNYTTSQGIEIEIADGAFDTVTPVQLRTVTETQDMVPAPRDFQMLNHFTLNLNGQTAKKPIELSFPIPQGLNVTIDSQIFVVKTVSFFGKRKYMPVEIVKLENGMLRTQSPPWPGITDGAISPTDAMGLIMADGASFYYLQGHVASLPAVIEFDNSDLAIVLTTLYDFIAPLPTNVNYQMTVSDLNTGATIFEGEPAPPATDAQQIILLQQAVSEDRTAPYVIGGTPMGLSSWRVGAASGDVREKIHFQATDANNDGVADITGSIKITGDAGALPSGTPVAIHNNLKGDTDIAVAAADGSFTISVAYTFGDPITLLLSSVDVEPGATFRFNFSEPAKDEDFTQMLEFYETDNPAGKISFTTELLNAQQILEIKPATSLKSDTDYTIKLQHIKDLVPNEMPKDFAVRFRTRNYNIVGDASSGKVNDTLLLRDHLIIAKDEGLEIYSTANPFAMGQTPVAQLPIIGGIRSLARYGNFVLGVGGGVNTSGVLHEFDFTDMEHPGDMAALILTRFIGDTSDDLDGSNPVPEGRPLKVMAIEGSNYAYVATLGVGVQVIDLTHLGFPIYNAVHRMYSEPNVKDMTLYLKQDAVDVVLSGISMHHDSDNSAVSLKTVDAAKVIAAGCDSQPCQLSAVKSTVIPGPANNVEVLQNYELDIDQDGRTGSAEDGDDDDVISQKKTGFTNPLSYEIHDLAFIASGSSGIHVVDITDIKDPQLLGTIKLGDGVTVADLKLDSQNLRLYAPVGGDGIYIVDIKDPFLIHPQTPPQVIGKIQISGTNTDGNVTLDPELNTVYIATADQGVKSVLVGKLNVEIVTDEDNNGVYEHVGVIESEGLISQKDETLQDGTVLAKGAPFPPGTKLDYLKSLSPKKYYLLAQLPSGAGGQSQEVKVKVSASNFFGTPIKLGAGFPDSEFETSLKYKAPTDQSKDSFRLFVSPPFYITAHPLLPTADKVEFGSKTIAAGDFVRVDLDNSIQQNLSFVTTDLLSQSRFSARSLRMDWIDSENPESRQNPVTGTGESDYPPYLHSGEWSYPETDIRIPGRGFDYTFTRRYESQALYDGPLGNGWDHACFARIEELPNGDVFYYDGMGRKEIFKFRGESDPKCANDKLCYVAPEGVFVTAAKLTDGSFLITESDGMFRLFNNYGQLATIQDRNENRMEMLYNPQGQLSVVVDTMGRPIYYAYNADGKLASVTDFANRTWKFHFDEGVTSPDPTKKPDVLTSVETPKPGDTDLTGRLTKYSYERITASPADLPLMNLKSITDARGVQFLVNTYDNKDQLEIEQYGDPTDTINFGYADGQTKVTDRNRHVTDYTLGSQSLLSRIDETTEDGTVETTFEHNAEGLLKQLGLPRGNQLKMDYPSITDPGNKRAAGNVLSVSRLGKDASGADKELKDTFDYQARYNIRKSDVDPRGHTTAITQFDPNDRNPQIIERPEGVKETIAYNDLGQKQLLTDTLGHKVKQEYYPEITSSQNGTATIVRPNANTTTGGYLRSRIYDFGIQNLQYQYEYDSRGNITKITDPRGIQTIYVYNNLDEVIEVVHGATAPVNEIPVQGESLPPAKSFHTLYKYDANGNVKEIAMEKEPGKFSSVYFDYDELNNLRFKREQLHISDTETIELKTEYQYDQNRNLRFVIYPEGNVTEFQYNARDLKIAEVRGEGSSVESRWSYKYDENKNLIEFTNAKGITHFDYDQLDRLIRITYPEGNFKTIDYDDDNLVTDENYFDAPMAGAPKLLAHKHSDYDELHRLHFESADYFDAPYATGNRLTTTYQYNTDSQLTDVTDPKGRRTHFEYDGAHRKKSITDAAGNAIEYGYDGDDNLASVTENWTGSEGSHIPSAKYVNRNSYDALNRVIATIDQLNHKTIYDYDLRNNLILSQLATGDLSTNVYDDLNRRILSRKVTGENGADITESFAYDKNGRMKSHQDAAGNLTAYQYDEIDRLKEINYPKGGAHKITYDGDDNIATTIDRNGTTVTNSYDGNDRLTGKTIARGAGVLGTTLETYKYDGLNRMIVAKNDDGEVQFSYDSLSRLWKDRQDAGVSQMEFDEVGNKKSVAYPNNSVTLNRVYDQIDRLRHLDTAGGNITDISYLGAWRVSDKTWGNNVKSQYDYDGEGRLIDISHGVNSAVAGFGYVWDDADFRKQEIKHHFADASDAFSYDGAHRITAGTVHLGNSTPHAQTFGYDAADNIRSVTKDAVSSSYVPNAENQFTSNGTENFEYDGNGNLTLYAKGGVTRRFAYDYLNRLMRAEATDSSGTKVETFAYDALGRRIKKAFGSEITKYVYEGQQVVQELDASNNIKREYIWGDEIDQLQAIRQNNQLYFVHENSIGSVAAITNSSGNLVERYDYDVFGFPTISDPSGTPLTASTLGQPYSFQGREWDDTLRLYYFRARYYDPSLGRFISQDPQGYSDSPNLYQAFLNNPANYTDPLGLEAEITRDEYGLDVECDLQCYWDRFVESKERSVHDYDRQQLVQAIERERAAGNNVSIADLWRAENTQDVAAGMRKGSIAYDKTVGEISRRGGQASEDLFYAAIPEQSGDPNFYQRANGANPPNIYYEGTKTGGEIAREGGRQGTEFVLLVGGTKIVSGASTTLRQLLTPEELAELESLEKKYPGWTPSDLDAPARALTPAEKAEARRLVKGKGHHRHPISFGGPPNPSEGLVETGDTLVKKNPIHQETSNFWNRVLRRIRSQSK